MYFASLIESACDVRGIGLQKIWVRVWVAVKSTISVRRRVVRTGRGVRGLREVE